MVYWNRFISYIHRYHGGRKCENVGFVKVAKAGRTGKMTIGIRDGMNTREEKYSVYIYRETLPEDGEIMPGKDGIPVMIPVPVFVGLITVRGGRGEGSFSFEWENVKGSRRPITAFAGLIIRRQGEGNSQSNTGLGDAIYYGSDMFCSSWTDSLVDYSAAWDTAAAEASSAVAAEAAVVPAAITAVAETAVVPAAIAARAEQTISDSARTDAEKINGGSGYAEAVGQIVRDSECADAGGRFIGDLKHTDTAERESTSENTTAPECASGSASAIENMFDSMDRLPLLPDSSDGSVGGVIESVRITPNDIGRLDMCNWKLGVNSFLTHGYYSYKYLMLGKVVFSGEDEPQSYILGVPGVYSAREKYLADIFGFDRFVPEKETRIKTGSFGYWIVNVR